MMASRGAGPVATDDAQQPAIQFEDIFSLRKPRDVKAGLSSGLKSMAKGVLAGAVGLVAAPIIGAAQDGLRGAAKGAAAGVAGAVVLPVTGFVVGGAQMCRGVVNTPEAIRQSLLGRYWDEDTRTWIDNPTLALALDDDDAGQARHAWGSRARAAGGRGGGGRGRGQGRQQGGGGEEKEDFYLLLEVPRDASPELIKKQYYILARRLHPDKNPDDPQAKERFQRLGEAYQVLCNPELRRRYDTQGAEGLDVNFMDTGEFFNALFGSDRFEHLVGELVIAAAARSGGDLTPAQLKRLQLVREERLVVMLNALLRRWVEEDYSGFKESMAAEAAELATASFGEVMLHTVGRVYEQQANIFLGGFIDGSLASLRAKGHSLKSQVNAASLALKVYQTQQQLERLERVQQEQQQLQQQAAPASPSDGESTAQQPPSNGAAAAATATAAGTGEEQGIDASLGATDSDGQQQQQTVEAAAAASRTAAAMAAATAAAAAAERHRLEEAALPIMLDAMWAANVLDIQATLRHVCQRVLSDPKVSKAVRRQRALGLRELGRIFRAARAPGSQGPAASAGSLRSSGGGSGSKEKPDQQWQQKTAKQHMEDAMQHVIDRRMQEADAAAMGRR